MSRSAFIDRLSQRLSMPPMTYLTRHQPLLDAPPIQTDPEAISRAGTVIMALALPEGLAP
jgi:hypothetical protein